MPGRAIVTIGESQWTVEVASTQTELMTGLAGRTSLTPGTGMLFILPSAQQVTVTTQNMLFPIDIIFIASNTVLDVASSIQTGYDVTEETPCDMFLEVNAGEAAGISQGDMVAVEYFSIVGDINAWIPPMVSLVGLGIIGTFLTGMVKTMTRTMLGKPKETELKLLPATKENLTREILKGLSTRDGYRAYVKYPKDKSAFVTIGAIIGGHYSLVSRSCESPAPLRRLRRV